MKASLKSLLVVFALLVCGTAFAAVQGKDYTLLNPAQPHQHQKIEVLEFFFYECSHCFHLHPELAAWKRHARRC